MLVIHTRGISKVARCLFQKAKKIDNMTTYPNYNHPFECCSLRCSQCTILYQNQNMTCAKQPSICLRLPLSLSRCVSCSRPQVSLAQDLDLPGPTSATSAYILVLPVLDSVPLPLQVNLLILFESKRVFAW